LGLFPRGESALFRCRDEEDIKDIGRKRGGRGEKKKKRRKERKGKGNR